MRLNERHLMQLAATLDAGGVTGGAALLGLTQPAVSRSLAALEARLGAPLFEPGRRPLAPTPLGAELAAHGRVLLAASRRAAEAAEAHLRGASGLVRVGGVPFFLDAMISRMVATFQAAEPGVAVRQSYGNADEMAAMLLADLVDLAVVPLASGEARPGLRFTEILPGRNVVAARAGHPLARRRRLRAPDLLAFPWVAPLPGSPLHADLRSILVGLGAAEVAVRYSGGSLLSVETYMAESDALAILPFSVVFAQRKAGRLVALPFDIPQPQRALGLLRLPDPRNPAALRLAAHVEASFADLRHLIRRHEEAIVWGP